MGLRRWYTLRGGGGRLVVPAEYRKALGLRVGDEVIIRLEGEELRMFAASRAVRYAQEIVRRYVATNRSLTSELIAERRGEAGRE
ncbi:MAG: AbrB/MazE/SpoVT family DNA-binding domain-containing protein [Limnochordales bacterium]|nr:AbrB/MazE/SpoVT family DNA-binding domain-containing protein [Limnochordales bacterium]